jgi:hypothetical protein
MKNNPLLKLKPFGFIVCLLTIVLSISIFIACKDTDEIVSGEIQTIPENSTSYLKFNGKALNHENAEIMQTENEKNGEILKFTILRSQISASDMSFVLSKIKNMSEISGIDKTDLIVFYTNKEDAIKNLTTNEVEGFSVFLPQTKGVHLHQLYSKNSSGTFDLKNDYTGSSDALTVNDLGYIGGTLFDNNSKVNIVSYYTNKYSSNGDEKIQSFTKLTIDKADFVLSIKDVFGCASGCDGGGMDCDIAPQGGSGACHGLCGFLNTLNQTKSKNLRVASIFTSSNAYAVRDDLLMKSKRGKKYVDYYYKVSDIAWRFDAINEKTLSKHINVATDIFKIADKLKKGIGSDVVVNEETSEKILSLIKDYRRISTNKEYQTILANVEKDLKFVTGKKKVEVETYLNNL